MSFEVQGWDVSTDRAAEAADAPLELSVVDAVLWACELSEDETEVGDLVDAALGRPEAIVIRESEPCHG